METIIGDRHSLVTQHQGEDSTVDRAPSRSDAEAANGDGNEEGSAKPCLWKLLAARSLDEGLGSF